MKIIQLEDHIAAAGQLKESDFALLAALGFRSVVNNRPDGEAADQLPDATARAAAARHGLNYRYQPVANANVTDDDVVGEFTRAMDELPGPVLFYCRTGNRCTALWVQAAAPRLGIAPALATAMQAGFDLEILRETIEERSYSSSGPNWHTTTEAVPQRN